MQKSWICFIKSTGNRSITAFSKNGQDFPVGAFISDEKKKRNNDVIKKGGNENGKRIDEQADDGR